MSPCPEYASELAAAAGFPGTLAGAAARHLEHCAKCSRAFAELNSAAALQLQTAHSLPAPTHTRGLALSFDGGAQQSARRHFAPALAFAAVALSALLIALFFKAAQPPQDAAEGSLATSTPEAAQPSPHKEAVLASTPTWGGLRQDLYSGNDPALPPRSGPAMSPYRVKDAYFEAN